MQLTLKLYAGKYKRITDPQPRGADCKSAPAAWSKVEANLLIGGYNSWHPLVTICQPAAGRRLELFSPGFVILFED